MVKVRLEPPFSEPLEDDLQAVPGVGEYIAIKVGGDLAHLEVKHVVHSKKVVRLILKTLPEGVDLGTGRE